MRKYFIILGISLLATQEYAQMPLDNIPNGLETSNRSSVLNNMNNPPIPYPNNSTYQSNMGNQYQYDLNNPSDRMSYQQDLDAQMRDKLNSNPTIQLDQQNGQTGGGVYPQD